MINKDLDPAEWAGLMYELEDAREHLVALMVDMEKDSEFDETDLRIQLGHIFSHLNRAWHRRKLNRDLSDEEWANASKFPNDLEPI